MFAARQVARTRTAAFSRTISVGLDRTTSSRYRLRDNGCRIGRNLLAVGRGDGTSFCRIPIRRRGPNQRFER